MIFSWESALKPGHSDSGYIYLTDRAVPLCAAVLPFLHQISRLLKNILNASLTFGRFLITSIDFVQWRRSGFGDGRSYLCFRFL